MLSPSVFGRRRQTGLKKHRVVTDEDHSYGESVYDGTLTQTTHNSVSSAGTVLERDYQQTDNGDKWYKGTLWSTESHLDRTDVAVEHRANLDVVTTTTKDKTDHVQTYALVKGTRSMTTQDDVVRDKQIERVSPRVVPTAPGDWFIWKSLGTWHEERHKTVHADIKRDERGALVAAASAAAGLLFDSTGDMVDLLNDGFTTVRVTSWTENASWLEGVTETKVLYGGADSPEGKNWTHTSATAFNGTDRLTMTETFTDWPGHVNGTTVSYAAASSKSLAAGLPSYVDPDGWTPFWSNVGDYIEDISLVFWDVAGVLLGGVITGDVGSLMENAEYLDLVVMQYLDGGALVDAGIGLIDAALDLIPFRSLIGIPQIGPVYGYTNAYAAGRVAGMIAGGVVLSMLSSGTGGLAACGSFLARASQVEAIFQGSRMVYEASSHIMQTGEVSFGDVVGLVVGVTMAFAGFKGLMDNCFIAGTEVLVEDPKKPGLFSEKKIEDVEVGDEVWTKDQNDPDAPLELKHVARTFRHTAYDLQTVSVEDETGNVEVIHVTDAHPFYVEGLGWTGAAELEAGEHLVSDDGEVLTVTANVDEPHPEGIPVFNFEVEGDHTYFVSDGIEDSVGDEDWVWVHNTCVYQELVNGKPRYIGITDQPFKLRAGQQLRNAGRRITEIDGLKNVGYKLARAIEHLLINKYGRIMDRFGNRLGGILTNLNRSIGQAKVHKYIKELEDAARIIKELGL